jgi:hypothetical protein
VIDQIFEKILTWADTEETIRVIIIEGSRARTDHSIDRFSDYDLDLYVTDVAQFTRSDTWIEKISPVWAMEKESEPDGTASRLASETARYLNYVYPYEMDKAISEFLLDNSPLSLH